VEAPPANARCCAITAKEPAMNWVALKMLTGDRGKYLALIAGVTFASLLMAQQVSIFWAVMQQATSQIRDVKDADVWVMDPRVRHIDEAPALARGYLARVRGVPGVAWAVPFFKGVVQARLPNGANRLVILMGVDDATLVGTPREIVLGSVTDLRRPDGIIIDDTGYRNLWPGKPLRLGRTLEINDVRGVVVGICKTSTPYQTYAVAYTRFSLACRYAPDARSHMPFVLVKARPGADVATVCSAITARTGLRALGKEEFCWQTMRYYLEDDPSVPMTFGITVFLGFIVGVAVAGQTFSLFTIQNLSQFGALKAMGVSNARLVGMILLQAVVVGTIGYGLGMGLTALFFEWADDNVPEMRGAFLPWQVMAGTAGAVLLIVVLAGLVSIRRVLVLEPAVVFRA
jgi:putative ABC transport system permease protein